VSGEQGGEVRWMRGGEGAGQGRQRKGLEGEGWGVDMEPAGGWTGSFM
jgi:hypothetical protein